MCAVLREIRWGTGRRRRLCQRGARQQVRHATRGPQRQIGHGTSHRTETDLPARSQDRPGKPRSEPATHLILSLATRPRQVSRAQRGQPSLSLRTGHSPGQATASSSAQRRAPPAAAARRSPPRQPRPGSDTATRSRRGMTKEPVSGWYISGHKCSGQLARLSWTAQVPRPAPAGVREARQSAGGPEVNRDGPVPASGPATRSDDLVVEVFQHEPQHTWICLPSSGAIPRSVMKDGVRTAPPPISAGFELVNPQET
jgi:hypothetical protein